ncbi:MAG: O-antigen ligase family protein [Canibacter sp.]
MSATTKTAELHMSTVASARARNEESLLILTFVLFILEGAVTNAAEFGFEALGLPGSQFAVGIIVYLPAVIAFLSRFTRGGRVHIGTFVVLYTTLATGFLLTAVLKPERISLMTAPEWPHNIYSYIFSPLSGIFAFLIIRALNRPEVITRALVLCAYANFAYGLVRYASFTVRGYWTGYSFTGEEQRLTYSLGFGYDMLLCVAVFGLLAFTGPRRWLHAILALASIGMIAVAGSRGPLLFAIISIATLVLYFGLSRARTSPLAAAGLALTVAFTSTLIAGFSSIIDWISRTLESMGISSRSVQSLASGEFGDDNGRAKIWDMSVELIQTGGLTGHGFYGDRIVISDRFFWGYPHNIALEFIITFGPIVGSILLLSIILLLARALAVSLSPAYQHILLVFFVMTLHLLISNSFLLSSWFWGLLAAIQLTLRAYRNRAATTVPTQSVNAA